MTKQSPRSRKLKMNRETVKVLSRESLAAVAGGADNPLRSAICSAGC